FTGVTFISSDLGTKRLELLRQLVSRTTTTMAMLIGPDVPETIAERADVQKAAQALGQQVVVAQATSLGEIAAAFTAFVERGAGSLFVGTGAFTNSHREAIVESANTPTTIRLVPTSSTRPEAVSPHLMAEVLAQFAGVLHFLRRAVASITLSSSWVAVYSAWYATKLIAAPPVACRALSMSSFNFCSRCS